MRQNGAPFPSDHPWITAWILLLMAPWFAHSEEAPEEARKEGVSIKSLWPSPTAPEVHALLEPGAGFSFVYDGRAAGPTFPSDWKMETRGPGACPETIFRHPSGLAAIRRCRTFPEINAIEYTVRLKNEGRSALPALTAVKAMDLTFAGEFVRGAAVLSSGGGSADAQFPPKNFALKRTPLDSPSSKVSVTLGTKIGVPSMEQLPFFFVHNDRKSSGLFVGIGWTERWSASIHADTAGQVLRLEGGIPDLDLQLKPDEEISGPTILIGGYRGSLATGSNQLRRLIRTRYAPRVGDQELRAPVLYTTWFNIGAELDEKLLLRLADDCAAMGVEVFLVDAGWYAGTPSRPYSDMNSTWQAISNSLGNWEQGEERSRFPSGLRALSEQVRSKGLQFGLWFEPERAGPDSLLAREHPDWVLRGPRGRWLLVDFGKPQVQEYFCKILDRFIRDLKLRYIRWDHNHHDGPLPFLQAQDPPGRRGISQIRYVEGLHRVEDWVRERHPEVVIESCAGGGRRIDLDTLRRRHTIWISDQTMNPDIVRFHLEGLNHFLPGNGQLVGFTPKAAWYERAEPLPDILYQNFFGGAFGAAGRLHQWSAPVKEQMRQHVAAFKKIRRYLVEDYYLLVPQARSLETWTGWQFHDPKTQEGFVQVFRLQAPDETRRFALHGLQGSGKYLFTDLYSGKTLEAAGARLLSPGLEFTLPQNASQVWLYELRK